MRKFSLLLFPLLLAACAMKNTNYYLPTVKSWLGAHTTELESRWGAPDDKINAGHGKHVYVYRTENNNLVSQKQPPVYAIDKQHVRLKHKASVATPGSQIKVTTTCYAIFKADRHGNIYAAEIEGQNCYGSRNFANTLANPAAK